MTWDADRDLEGEPAVLRVSASDLSGGDGCARSLAAKVRPFARPKGWKRVWPPDRFRTPFPLGDVIEIAVSATRHAPLDDYQAFESWIRTEIDERSPSRLVRPYLDAAVRNALDAHSVLEGEVGALTVAAVNPEIGPTDRKLQVWGPLYASDDGVSEIRRFRIGSAHTDPDESDLIWIRAAAWIAAKYPTAVPVTRVRVVEVGLGDGSVAVVFDDDADRALPMLDPVRPMLRELPLGIEAKPGQRCGQCKLTGVCDALPRVTGALGPTTFGHQTRSVSPSALETYRQCPARWLLSHELHLPRTVEYGEAQLRGLRVHEWLDTAHRRGTACTYDDLPNPDDGMGLAEPLMTREEYELAFPLLLSHVEVCQLATEGAALIASERTFHAFDDSAEVVLVCKPDLTTSRGATIVFTEVKTSIHEGPSSANDAFSSTLQVPMMLSMLAKGLAQALGFEAGEVRLEYLTPGEARVWTWSTDDAEQVKAAGRALKGAASSWHTDHEWQTRPGAHCAWCPVRQWCPDRDAYLQPLTGETGTRAPDSSVLEVDDEDPPF